jgi:two-component system chemotaxis sensor kinase CheA
MYDFGAIAEFVHSLENVLDGVRGGRIELTDTLIAAVLRCKDHLLDRMRSYENGRYESDDLLAEGQEAVALLLEAAGEEAPKQQKKQEAVAGERASELWKIHLRCKPNLLANGLDPYPFLRFLTEKGKIEELAVDDSLLPVLTDLDPQSAYLSFDIVYRSTLNHKQIVDAFEFAAHDVELTVEPLIAIGHASGEAVREQKTAKSAPAAKAAAADQKAAKAKTKRSMRVDADKLDLVVDRVGEAVVIASAIHQMALNLKDEYLEELSHRMSRLLTEIRTNSLKLRMVPVETVFARFSRVVYEMGLQLGKPVQLVLHGGETELDKNLIDHLADPLTHMVRNAIDHGIESSPEERERAGKPREATITLSASHRAGEIIIEVSDDGHGINPDAVLRRAVERGLYNEGDPIREDQIYRFIFEPGFSTAKEVTELSGRGVGLDVVRKNVESLRGRIEVESERGKGTMFRIILPLTLANIDGFLLRVGNNQYAIPLDMVNECMEFRAEDFVVGEQNFIRVRGKVIPFINMNELFGEPEEKGSRRNLVIVHAGSLQAGLVVDDLLGRMHSVIKPLGELFEETKGLSGFAVMGDGSVAMILDTGTLLAEVRRLNDRMVEENIERELADVYVD